MHMLRPDIGYYLAAGTSSQSYDGEYHWLIELEKGWSPWMPGNEPQILFRSVF